jgi:5-formyltetrahydrofolate cyclo-ligase
MILLLIIINIIVLIISSIAMLSSTSIGIAKNSIRQEIKNKLKTLSIIQIEEQSLLVTNSLCYQQCYLQSKAICIYLSMKNEIMTLPIIKDAFNKNKRVFIPKVLGGKSEELVLYELSNYSEIDNFPKSKWGIPEPTIEMVNTKVDGINMNIIDLIVVPGVAFDIKCGRVGHGKGYYDCLLERINNFNTTPVITIGLALEEQVIQGEVPKESHDISLNYIITPSNIYTNC